MCAPRNDGSGDAFCVRLDPELTVAHLNSLCIDDILIPYGGEFGFPDGSNDRLRQIVQTALADLRWLELYKRVVETINLSLYRRYNDDITCAMNAIRGTAHHYWLAERGGMGTLNRVHPINHTYFTR